MTPIPDHEIVSDAHRVVFVTGPSGAGRSTAINVLEDLDHEAIDNLPLSLLPRLLKGPVSSRPMALGTDFRNRDFSVRGLIRLINKLRDRDDVDLTVVYLDCSANALLRRFSETRRRHPAAVDDTPEVGIAREADLLAPLRDLADTVIDTTEMSVHDLRADLEARFATPTTTRMALSVQSFSYKRGLPHGLDMAFDVRFLRNPYWNKDLRPLNGTDPAVQAYVADDEKFAAFFDRVEDMILSLLPAFLSEGKSHLSIGFGCSGGQHRSVTMAERLTRSLENAGWQVTLRHRELLAKGMIAERGKKAS